ncbi:ice-binding family protein [Streptosporangium sp. NPDC001681]|uniref:ice-binding family protein n=1 Tax=Streptosporangium sp. NPDC001681 TaxID=3154395 RepID=UPI00332C35E9
MINSDRPRALRRNGLSPYLEAALAAVLTLGIPLVTPLSANADIQPVTLGQAEDCAVLAGNAVTSTDLTTIIGTVALSPGITMTGFPPGIVRGEVHQNDAEAQKEKADAVAAYNDAAGRTPTATIPPNLGEGATITPGVYDTPGGVFELAGTLTLDAQGDPDATFIFQADSALNTAKTSNIDLTNGAQEDNIIWQVGDSATLGEYSTFRGTVLALNDVKVMTGAAMHGRAMALNNVVTLNGTTILPATQIMLPNAPETDTSLTSSLNPSRLGDPVTFVARVSGDFHGVSPTNTVLFKDDSVVIGSAMLDDLGVATFTTAELTKGVHPITAVYVAGGTSVGEAWVNFAPSESPVVNQQVLDRGTT